MKKLALLKNEERRAFFEAAAEESTIPVEIIEKDFWVVWTLERLFSLQEIKPHLTFKGGTSLSKVYKIIKRFSEDIDVSVDKTFLGFGEENNPEKATSKTKQKALLKELAQACSEYVQNKLRENLEESIQAGLHTSDNWALRVDADDKDGQTLLFDYPTSVSEEKYIKPSVKIEMGARSDHWPVHEHSIQSYLKLSLGEKVEEPPVIVKVLNAERTFWEKATILHMVANLPEARNVPARFSRHYYDFFCLLNSSFKKGALDNIDLLERVSHHKSIYFPAGWAKYENAKRGSLKVSPSKTSPRRAGKGL